jgi:hypothetical protein
MKRIRRFGGITFLAAMAGFILLLPAFGSAGANAQRPLPDTSDVLKPQKPVRQPAVPAHDVFQPQKPARQPEAPAPVQRAIQIRRLLPGANAPGIVHTDVVSSPSAPAAAPNSGCVLNPGPQPASGHTCNIYESNGAGTPGEISNVITIPNVVVGGYLVLKANGAIADNVVSNWSDVLKFGDGSNNNTTTMQLFSLGCNTGNPNDTSCFPPYSPATSGFVTESNPGPTVFFNTPNTYNIYSIDDAPIRPFTLASSVGTVDEDSAAIVQLKNFTVTLLPLVTGSVHMRYNITAVDDISRLCPASHSVVRVRFRNNDNTGTAGQVSFEVHSTNITAGGNNLLYTFSSNGRGAGGAFTTATDTAPVDFDFANNIYWIEATIFRSDPNVLSDLGSIQIWEAAGNPCP